MVLRSYEIYLRLHSVHAGVIQASCVLFWDMNTLCAPYTLPNPKERSTMGP